MRDTHYETVLVEVGGTLFEASARIHYSFTPIRHETRWDPAEGGLLIEDIEIAFGDGDFHYVDQDCVDNLDNIALKLQTELGEAA